jgi:hypothetical protein
MIYRYNVTDQACALDYAVQDRFGCPSVRSRTTSGGIHAAVLEHSCRRSWFYSRRSIDRCQFLLWLLAHGPERFLYAFLFAVLDASTAFLLPIRDAFLERSDNRSKRTAGWALAAFFVFAPANFICEVGLYKIIKGRVAGETATAASAVNATKRSKNDAEAELRRTNVRRSFPEVDFSKETLPTLATINMAIANAKLNDLWRRSRSCENVTLEDSRSFCMDYNALVAAATNRKIVDDYNGDLQTKQGQETRNQAGKKDEQAATFARWLHVTLETANDVLACAVAFLIELGSVLLPWFAISLRNRQEPAIPAVPGAVLPPPEPEHEAPIEEDAGERAAQRRLDASVIRQRGAFTPSAEIWKHYGATIERNLDPKLDRGRLGKFLRARGYKARKKGGLMRYEGVVLLPLTPQPPKTGMRQLRVAADNRKGFGQMTTRKMGALAPAAGA